jgi:dTDP-4-amino-4,6-dideoxygalactose transaminase
MPPFKNVKVETTINRENTENLSRYGICLPYGYDMSENKVAEVVSKLKRVLK